MPVGERPRVSCCQSVTQPTTDDNHQRASHLPASIVQKPGVLSCSTFKDIRQGRAVILVAEYLTGLTDNEVSRVDLDSIRKAGQVLHSTGLCSTGLAWARLIAELRASPSFWARHADDPELPSLPTHPRVACLLL